MSVTRSASVPDGTVLKNKRAQLQNRSKKDVQCRQPSYNHVTLPLLGGKMEVTEDPAVFIKSPNAERRLQKQQAKQHAKRPETAPELPSIGSSLRQLPLAGDDWPFDSFAEDACSQDSCEGPSDSECATEISCSSNEEDRLQNGVMRRVAEQVLVVNLKQLAAKQTLRYGRPSGHAASSSRLATPSGPAASKDGPSSGRLTTPSGCRPSKDGGFLAPPNARQRVRVEATKFTELYANTASILERHMTLSPPSTRHSVTNAELQAYGGGGTRSMVCTPDSPVMSNSDI